MPECDLKHINSVLQTLAIGDLCHPSAGGSNAAPEERLASVAGLQEGLAAKAGCLSEMKARGGTQGNNCSRGGEWTETLGAVTLEG